MIYPILMSSVEEYIAQVVNKSGSDSSDYASIDNGNHSNDNSGSMRSSDKDCGGKYTDKCLRELKESNLLDNLHDKLASVWFHEFVA